MSYQIFDKDEQRFEDWRATHTNAIVVNSSPGRLDPKYVKAHRPRCESFGSEARTAVYSKHCFDSAAEALKYLRDHGIEAPTFGCKKCKVSMLVPTDDPAELDLRSATLMAEDIDAASPGNSTPRRAERMGSDVFERDPFIVAWILQKAAGKCELCDVDAPILTPRGTGYLEVHHVRRLADGGPDTVDNAVALCPNCHRALHYAVDAVKRTKLLYAKKARLCKHG